MTKKPNDPTSNLNKLFDMIKELRSSEKGCAWTKKQTFKSLANHTLEEAYEIVSAIDQNDFKELCDELGDMLYHIIFYAYIAEEKNLFDFEDVAGVMLSKHKERRPTLTSAELDAEQVNAQWESIKKEKRKRSGKSLLDDVTLNLPSLTRALKLQQRAANVGFDWKNIQPVFEKIYEEIDELKEEKSRGDKVRIEEEFGDVLFSCVNLSRHLKVNPEEALRAANNKFKKRFQKIEKYFNETKKNIEDASLEELEKLWEATKK